MTHVSANDIVWVSLLNTHLDIVRERVSMQYDYIIVGAGSAGSVLASRLTENPDCSVLLLEAGPDYWDFETMPDSVKFGNSVWPAAYGPEAETWGYMANATPDREPFPLPRGKLTGGSSSINGQVFFRGIPEDYDEWAELGSPEWAFVNVLPYFRKSETDLTFGADDFHGGEGPIPVRRYTKDEVLPIPQRFWETCLAAGYPEAPDQNHPEAEGVGPRPLNNVDGVRMSTNLTYLSMSRHRLNLTIRSNVLAHRILFEGDRAIGIEAESGGDTFQVFGDEIILSGGAINSPHLLMLSGVGPRDQLESLGISVVHELPGVGENLRDHPAAFMLFKAATEDPPAGSPSIQVGMRYTTPGSPHRNDMQMSPILLTSEHRPTTIDIPEGETYTGFSVALQKALSAGRISLTSTDPSTQPNLDYRYLVDERDRERMRGAVRTCVELTQQSPLSDVIEARISPTDDDLATDDALDAWLLANVGTQHHSSGTCKMGPGSDPMAVVDQYLHVHGLQGLRVIDASVMPDVVRANTNATTIMIAERAADWLAVGK